MAIAVTCAACGRQYRLSDAAAGTLVKCLCGQEFVTPSAQPGPSLLEEAFAADHEQFASQAGPSRPRRSMPRRPQPRYSAKPSGNNAVLITAGIGGVFTLTVLIAFGVWLLSRPRPPSVDAVPADVAASLPSGDASLPPAQDGAGVALPPASPPTAPNGGTPAASSVAAVTAPEPHLASYTGFKYWELSADSTRLATCDQEAQMANGGVAGYISEFVIWDAATGKRLFAWKTKECEHSFCLSPDGKLLAFVVRSDASNAAKESLAICNAETGEEVRRVSGEAFSYYFFSGDGSQIIVWQRLGEKAKFYIVDINSGSIEQRDPGFPTKFSVPVAYAAARGVVARGKVVLQVLPGRKVKPTALVELYELDSDHTLDRLECVELVAELAFSPDGEQLAACLANGRIIVWKMNALGKPKTFTRPAESDGQLKFLLYNALAFSPNGKWLVASATLGRGGRGEQALEVWDLASGACTIVDRQDNEGMQFLADGRLLVARRRPKTSFKVLAPPDWQPVANPFSPAAASR